MNIEKVLTEVREALSRIARQDPDESPEYIAETALAAFTAEMPGAIGVVIRRASKGGHGAECAMTGIGWRCVCGLSDALVELKGNPEIVREVADLQIADSHKIILKPVPPGAKPEEN